MAETIDADYLARRKAEQRAASDAWFAQQLALAGGPLQPGATKTTPPVQQPESAGGSSQSVASEVGGGIARGFGMAFGEPVGTAIELAGKATGLDTVAQFGEHIVKGWQNVAASNPRSPDAVWNGAETLLHPRWWTATIAETIPQLAAMFIPSAAVAREIKLAGVAYKWTPELALKLSRIGAAVTGGAVGGVIQGSGTYQAMMEKGASEPEALTGAAFMATVAAGANAVTYASAFLPRGAASQIGGTAALGAVTNWLQSGTGSMVLGSDVFTAMQQATEALFSGGIMGGAAAAGAHLMGRAGEGSSAKPGAPTDAAPTGTVQGGPDLTQTPEGVGTATTASAAAATEPAPPAGSKPNIGEPSADVGQPLTVNLKNIGGTESTRRVAESINRMNSEVMARDREVHSIDLEIEDGMKRIPSLDAGLRWTGPEDITHLPGDYGALRNLATAADKVVDELLSRGLSGDAEAKADLPEAIVNARLLSMKAELAESAFGRTGKVAGTLSDPDAYPPSALKSGTIAEGETTPSAEGGGSEPTKSAGKGGAPISAETENLVAHVADILRSGEDVPGPMVAGFPESPIPSDPALIAEIAKVIAARVEAMGKDLPERKPRDKTKDYAKAITNEIARVQGGDRPARKASAVPSPSKYAQEVVAKAQEIVDRGRPATEPEAYAAQIIKQLGEMASPKAAKDVAPAQELASMIARANSSGRGASKGPMVSPEDVVRAVSEMMAAEPKAGKGPLRDAISALVKGREKSKPPTDSERQFARMLVSELSKIMRELPAKKKERGPAVAPAFTKDEVADFAQSIANGDPIEVTMARMDAVRKLKGKSGTNRMLDNLMHGARRGESVFYEAWINGMLSNPATHAANLISNTLTAVWAVPERMLAENAPGHQVVRGEGLAMMRGAVEGFMDAFRFAGLVLKTGEGATKLESKVAAIRAPAAIAESPLGHAINFVGEAIRSPGRALQAGDAFFKGIAYRMELKAQALRLATAEGLSGKDLATRMAEIEAKPPKGLDEVASQFALMQTFQNDLGTGMQGFQQWVQNTPGMRLVLPFIRTPVNLAKWSIARTPGLQFALREMRTDLARPGAARDLALAKVAAGGMLTAGVAVLAASRQISGGGPRDKALRDILKSTGWQPYSIKVGDTWYSYSRTDPVGMTLGIVADAADIMGHLPGHEADQLGMTVALAVSRNIGSKTYLTGLSNVVEAIQSPDRRGHAFAEGLARSMVPAGVRAVARTQDRTLHETRTLLDQIQAGVPGWSKSLPPSRNLLADPILLTGGMGPDIVSPIYQSPEKHDPVLDELARSGVSLSMPPKVLFGTAPPGVAITPPKPGEGVKLTPQQYDQFVRLAGEPLRGALGKLFETRGYKNGTDAARQLLIRSVVSAYREAAQAKLLREDSGLRVQFREQRIRKAQSLTNRPLASSSQGVRFVR